MVKASRAASWIYIYIYIYIYMCVCVCIYIYIYIYVIGEFTRKGASNWPPREYHRNIYMWVNSIVPLLIHICI